jgi:DNA-binding NarL/FixJ family response regulator
MKFVLVEDQAMFRALIRKLLIEECKGKVSLEAGTLAELRTNFETLREADLILLDIRLPDGDGIDFVDELVKGRVSTPVLLFSSSCEDYVVHRVSRAFVQGFVHKDEDPQMLLTAIQMVAAGGAFFSPRFVERRGKLARDQSSFDKLLSPREQDFLRLIGAGCSDAEAAAELGLGAATAQTHRRNVMGKLNLHTAQELQAYALKMGFTTIDRLSSASGEAETQRK